MTSRHGRFAAWGMWLLLGASAVVAVVAFVVAGSRLAARRAAAPREITVSLVAFPDQPIVGEAQVFRTRTEMLSIGDPSGPRRAAHPRTLATYRVLRAYPGAPPRIPHGLTPGEFREGACKACHERGGFSVRFNAYVPVTPHPEMGACLQCHVGDAKLMAIPLPSTDPNSRCRQCHTAGGSRASDSTLDWKTMPWPSLMPVSVGRTPPPIPHDAPMRTNCLACHAGPSGVVEIRTSHPERADCRQCHLQASALPEPDASVARGAVIEFGGAP
ncbi:MAG: hypothetical protein ABMA00_02495 [Gemmatimonas sp.]